MESHLAVDEKNSLTEVRPQRAKQTLPVRIAARIISYLFHPLFIPVYLSWLVLKPTHTYLLHSLNGKKQYSLQRLDDVYLVPFSVSIVDESSWDLSAQFI